MTTFSLKVSPTPVSGLCGRCSLCVSVAVRSAPKGQSDGCNTAVRSNLSPQLTIQLMRVMQNPGGINFRRPSVEGALLPNSKGGFETALEKTLRTTSDDSAGLEVGRAAAAAILSAREKYGENRTVHYTPGTKPSEYRPTLTQHWGSVTPFC
jgi:hypothetical protein